SLNSFVAWMCISAALFGVGLGGLLFDWRAKAERWVWTLLGLVLMALPLTYNHLSFTGVGPWAVLNYTVLILLLSVPFALIGWGVLQLFARTDARVERLYLCDLAGGGLGACTAFFVLGPLSPAQILVVAGLFCLVVSQSGSRRAVAVVLAGST